MKQLSDYLEDIPGSSIDVYSCNHGDDQNTARRPRLILDWHAPDREASVLEYVILEHGRSVVLSRVDDPDLHSVAVSYIPAMHQARPTISIRGVSEGAAGDWVPIELPRATDWKSIEVRRDAHCNPVPFGHAFEAEFRDTWVPSGPVEEQSVTSAFISPSSNSTA